MTDFLIRDIEPYVLEHLRRRAERNRRSLQAEIKRTLSKAVKLNKEESLALMRKLRAELPYSETDSTQLIREDRDSR
jgi:plasmid stability protein